MMGKKHKKTLYEKEERKSEIKAVIFILLFIFLFFIGCHYTDKSQKEQRQKQYEYYQEWCPKLNATVIENAEINHGGCFKEEDNIIIKYLVVEINGERKLREEQ